MTYTYNCAAGHVTESDHRADRVPCRSCDLPARREWTTKVNIVNLKEARGRH